MSPSSGRFRPRCFGRPGTVVPTFFANAAGLTRESTLENLYGNVGADGLIEKLKRRAGGISLMLIGAAMFVLTIYASGASSAIGNISSAGVFTMAGDCWLLLADFRRPSPASDGKT